MRSQIYVKTANWKATVTIGFFALILIIFLAIWFAWAVQVVILAIGGVVVIGGLAWIGLYARAKSLAGKMEYQKLRQETYLADRMEAERYVLPFDHKQRLLLPLGARFQTIEPVLSPKQLAAPQALALPEPESPPITYLEILPTLQTVLILGGQNSGKTTLLQHSAANRQGEVYVIDPHGMTNWPADWIAGPGRDFDGIAFLLDKLLGLLTIRYQQLTNRPQITLIADEWLALIDNIPSAGPALKTLTTEGRKAGIFCFLGSHSDRAKPLGLEGAADIKEGMVKIYLKKGLRGQRTAQLLGDGGNLEDLITPGPFASIPLQAKAIRAPGPRPELTAQAGRACVVCGQSLTGRQAKFCSQQCKDGYHNLHR